MSRAGRASRRGGPILLTLAVLAAATGCGRFQAPPVELSFRDSLVGAGKIVRIENTSNEALTGVEVTISAPSGESRTFSRKELGGYQTLEIGWKKLGGWQVPLGARVEVGADGYFLAFKGQLPDAEADG